jgi:hypothetical protein
MSTLLHDVDVQSLYVPELVAKLLVTCRTPATIVLGKIAGTTMSLAVDHTGSRGITLGEAGETSAAEDDPCWWRTGTLVTAEGVTAAGTFLLWLPGRLDSGTNAALLAGQEPAGIILHRLGMRRDQRRAIAVNVVDEVTGQDAGVTSRAVLMVDGVAVGIAEENILWPFLELIAD